MGNQYLAFGLYRHACGCSSEFRITKVCNISKRSQLHVATNVCVAHKPVDYHTSASSSPSAAPLPLMSSRTYFWASIALCSSEYLLSSWSLGMATLLCSCCMSCRFCCTCRMCRAFSVCKDGERDMIRGLLQWGSQLVLRPWIGFTDASSKLMATFQLLGTLYYQPGNGFINTSSNAKFQLLGPLTTNHELASQHSQCFNCIWCVLWSEVSV